MQIPSPFLSGDLHSDLFSVNPVYLEEYFAAAIPFNVRIRCV